MAAGSGPEAGPNCQRGKCCWSQSRAPASGDPPPPRASRASAGQDWGTRVPRQRQRNSPEELVQTSCRVLTAQRDRAPLPPAPPAPPGPSGVQSLLHLVLLRSQPWGRTRFTSIPGPAAQNPTFPSSGVLLFGFICEQSRSPNPRRAARPAPRARARLRTGRGRAQGRAQRCLSASPGSSTSLSMHFFFAFHFAFAFLPCLKPPHLRVFSPPDYA